DADALAMALTRLVQGHQALCYGIVSEDGWPRAHRLPEPEPSFETVDLSELSAAAQSAEAQRLREAYARQLFDLERGPLLRALLVRLGPEAYELTLVLHHLVSDAHSMAVLWWELAAHYRALCQRGAAPTPLVLGFYDYAAWRRQALESGRLADSLEYWRSRLSGAPALEVPGDRPCPSVRTVQGGLVTRPLPGLATEVEALARAEAVTVQMVLMTGYAMLLARLGAGSDLVLGMVSAGRAHPELDPLVGFFVNTLALRLDLHGNPTVQECLARVRSVTLEAFEHQDVPFEQVVEALAPERDTTRTPLIQAMFTHQRTESSLLDLGEARGRVVGVDNGCAKFDLTLIASETSAGLAVTMEYSTDLFSPEGAAVFLARYERLLRTAVASPQRRLSSLPLLSESERA
ncbi:MAG: non-ribosomal peptide synthetase, partial [bacterium]|nr:non-ribosomal peptide synthetase [bacterium]